MQKFKPFSAPKSFVFKDPDTGHLFKAASMQHLADMIASYRAQNDLEPIEYLPEVLENYWCTLPENEGSCEPVTLDRSLTLSLKGGIALLQNLFYGQRNMVNLTTASDRANVCLPCPLNNFPDRSGFIKWSDALAEQATKDRFRDLSPHLRDNLGNCLGCSCTLKAKVFYKPNPKLTKPQQDYMRAYNPKCWQIPENWKLEK